MNRSAVRSSKAPPAPSGPPSASRHSRSRRWRFWVLVACFSTPLLGLGVAGALWLYERRWLGWAGLLFLGGETIAYLLFRRWSRRGDRLLPQPPQVPPAEFSPREQEAWQVVREYEGRIERGEIMPTSFEQLLSLGREILERVATFYRPGERDPLLAVPMPLLLRAMEETARDLATITADLPLAHRITIGDVIRGYHLSQKLRPAYNVYRVLSPLWSWQHALVRMLVTDRLFALTRETLNQWLLRWYVDRVGYHAIELYSGRLLLTKRIDDAPPLSSETAKILGEEHTLQTEPLRILVLGQVKAGKSSLVNALFGEVRAATDVVPTTTQLTTYVLERPALGGKVILADLGGYEDPSATRGRTDEVLAEAVRSDVLILVLSAVNTAREPDCRLLAQLRERFARQPQLRPPPVIVALTHIDLLRPPLEWTPPYDIITPALPKARSIRDALDAAAAELSLSPEVIVPVCLRPDRIYNVEETLVPLLVNMLPEGKCTLLLRTLKTLRDREQWELVGRQARAAGRFLCAFSKEMVKKSLVQVLAKSGL